MSTLSRKSEAEVRNGLKLAPVVSVPNLKRYARPLARSQRGVVMFFALIALVVISLAAVALIRSVDTSTMIAGNIAFKQAATASGDAGLDTAVDWLAKQQSDMDAAGKTVLLNADHTLNNTNAATGYYSNADSALCLSCDAVWDAIDPTITFTDLAGNTKPIVISDDGSGNEVRFIIQRMCRYAYPGIDNGNIPQVSNCLFTDKKESGDEHDIVLPQDVCLGSGCPPPGQFPQMRITARVKGPRNTLSYIQSFVN